MRGLSFEVALLSFFGLALLVYRLQAGDDFSATKKMLLEQP
jgi:hypothetical protein